jgi:hypothetical protein
MATLGPESDRPENFFVSHGRKMPETVPSTLVLWVDAFLLTPRFSSPPVRSEDCPPSQTPDRYSGAT